jgi:hypothetical protein
MTPERLFWHEHLPLCQAAEVTGLATKLASLSLRCMIAALSQAYEDIQRLRTEHRNRGRAHGPATLAPRAARRAAQLARLQQA